MMKNEILKQIKKDYPEDLFQVGKEQYILLDTVGQIVSDFLENVKINATQFWQPCVNAYFKWYKTNYGFEPDFKGQNSRHFKQIMEKLKKTALENNLEWSEKVAVKYICQLMNAAYKDEWLKKNFLLRNINDQYSKIRANERERNKQQNQPGWVEKIGRLSPDKIQEFLSE